MRVLGDVIPPRWRDTPVDCAPPRAIQEWPLTLASAQATRTVAVMRRLMDSTVDYELTDANRFRLSYEMPVTRKAVKRRDVCTLEQAEAMLTACAGPCARHRSSSRASGRRGWASRSPCSAARSRRWCAAA